MEHLSHTAKPSAVGAMWRKFEPYVPAIARVDVRRYGQYIHSRHLKSSDSLLLSYPKSGSTWVRDMLATLLAGHVIAADDLAVWSPPLHLCRQFGDGGGRIVRSHDRVGTPGFARAGKVLVLVRDPRALVVSWSFHRKRRGIETSVESATDELLTDGFMSLGSWKAHIQHAVARSMQEDCMILRYEDLIHSTSEALKATSVFLNIAASDEIYELAIEAARPSSLRSRRVAVGLERQGELISDVRSAKSDGWLKDCPQSCQSRICDALEAEMAVLGYRT